MTDADEVLASLTHGDHLRPSRPLLRGILGLGVLAAGIARASCIVPLGEVRLLHVVANPVAHGGRLAESVSDAFAEFSSARVADGRHSAIAVDVSMPGLAARSMLAIVNRRSLASAWRLRRAADRRMVRVLSPSRLYAEYLFLAQTVRYDVIGSSMAASPSVGLVLSDFDRAAYARPWVWSAKQRGVATVTMVHGSPNENYVPVIADTVMVWGQVQADWFAVHSPGTHVEIVGRPDMSEQPPRDLPFVLTMDDIHRQFG